MAKYADGKKAIEAELAQMKKHCTTIRVLAHTQVRARVPGGGGFRACPRRGVRTSQGGSQGEGGWS